MQNDTSYTTYGAIGGATFGLGSGVFASSLHRNILGTLVTIGENGELGGAKRNILETLAEIVEKGKLGGSSFASMQWDVNILGRVPEWTHYGDFINQEGKITEAFRKSQGTDNLHVMAMFERVCKRLFTKYQRAQKLSLSRISLPLPKFIEAKSVRWHFKNPFQNNSRLAVSLGLGSAIVFGVLGYFAGNGLDKASSNM